MGMVGIYIINVGIGLVFGGYGGHQVQTGGRMVGRVGTRCRQKWVFGGYGGYQV